MLCFFVRRGGFALLGLLGRGRRGRRGSGFGVHHCSLLPCITASFTDSLEEGGQEIRRGNIATQTLGRSGSSELLDRGWKCLSRSWQINDTERHLAYCYCIASL